ncbi:MAG: hypothetical protein QOF97_937 [Acidimicrobiaceae bacterium]|jgi:hypothetical protein
MTNDPNIPNEPPSEPLTAGVDQAWSSTGPPKGIRVNIPIAIAVVAVVAMLGVWGGAQLKGGSASATVAAGGQGANGAARGYGGGAGQGGNGQRGGGAAGTVQSVNGNTITITDQQGATKTITLDPSTTISKSTTGSVSDITTGETIVVRGTANSDGSTTAQTVTIGNGALPGGGFPGGGAPPNAAPSGN